jgi:hypothetical protein
MLLALHVAGFLPLRKCLRQASMILHAGARAAAFVGVSMLRNAVCCNPDC